MSLNHEFMKIQNFVLLKVIYIESSRVKLDSTYDVK